MIQIIEAVNHEFMYYNIIIFNDKIIYCMLFKLYLYILHFYTTYFQMRLKNYNTSNLKG